jgi:cold shock CspA family protein
MSTAAHSLMTNATVKRFHPVRGGFVSSPAFPRELYVKPAVVEAAGLDRLVKDEKIDIEASETDQGPLVTKILRHTTALVFHDAVIKSYFPKPAYGFAVLPNGHDVFVHKSVLKHCNIDEAAMTKDARVEVAYVAREHGLRAISIRLA